MQTPSSKSTSEKLTVRSLKKEARRKSCSNTNLMSIGSALGHRHPEANTATERQQLWENITFHAGNLAQSPWLLMGDFNVIPNTNEKHGGNMRWCPAMMDFKECLQKAELEDLKFNGILYTWDLRPQSHLGFLEFQHPKKEHPIQKLKLLKQALKNNCKKEFTYIDLKLHAVKLELDACQTDVDIDPSNEDLRHMEKILTSEYLRLAKHQEDMMRQKSRMTWLKLGDSNTSYFHKSLSSRNNRKKIVSLTTKNGQVLTDCEAI
ncbi:uncharacterized protein LOC132279732 [Cornus florida]|uniref:uncharacterized protein LOC132279732 n=1 Tax=Cornus florida TaxID=4283 RepID=UPI00289CE2C2|nr:uncharacterized protein LOC132279732 [Cornus florida]